VLMISMIVFSISWVATLLAMYRGLFVFCHGFTLHHPVCDGRL
jgi:hypothetical protein